MEATTPAAPPPKKIKKQGPIRWGALVPSLIIIGLVVAYFVLFFDGHLRRGLEYVGTQVNGAEVNIASLNTNFIKASIAIKGVQVTDKEKPHRNIFQVGDLRFQLLWDALLRAKLVIGDASILGIEALVDRKSPGYVVPPPPPSNKPSLLENAQNQVLRQTQKQYKDNFLGDIARVLGGTDPKEQLKNMEAELKASGKLKELEKELNEKKEVWEKRIKELPQADTIKGYEKQIKALKFDGKNPAELAKNISKANDIIKEAKEKIELVDKSQKELSGDIKTYTQAFKDVEDLIQSDLKDLQKKLNIPDIDPKEFSTQLFLSMVESKLISVRKYAEMAKKYMPPKKTAAEKKAFEEEKLTPHERSKGRTIQFPVTTGYPLFWLKHAAISSELGTSELSGDIKGEIDNITSDPVYLGKPATLHLAGNFPKQRVMGVDLLATVDHTTDRPKESLVAKVGSYPVGEQKFADSPDVRLGIVEAKGASQLEASLGDGAISLAIRNQFTAVRYDVDAKLKPVKEILLAVLNGIPTITMNANVSGSWDSFSLHINSNLGEELSSGFKKQIQVKIEEAKAQLRKIIDGKIGGERAKVESQLHELTGGLSKNLGKNREQMDKILNNAQKGAKGKGGQKAVEDEGKKLLKKLFK